MAYSRFTLNKNEKMQIGFVLVLALIPFLNNLFPQLKNFWKNTLKLPANLVDNTLEDVGMVAVGFAIVKVSKGLILSAIVPYLFQGKSLAEVFSGSGNGQLNG
jgi:uncharacterized protein YjeT (DUF2065 family)